MTDVHSMSDTELNEAIAVAVYGRVHYTLADMPDQYRDRGLGRTAAAVRVYRKGWPATVA